MGNADLANLSDKLMLTTVILYIVALVAYAGDLGFGRRRAAADSAERAAEGFRAEKAEKKVLAGSGGTGDADTVDAGPGEEPEPSTRADWGRLAVVLTVFGALAHLGIMVTRGLAVERWPWGNMYEFLTAIAFTAVVGLIIVMWRFDARYLGAPVTLAAVIALGAANIWLYTPAGPVVPALNSYWIALHVAAAVIATGAFTVSGAVTVVYLVKSRREAAEKIRPDGILARMPSTGDLDRLALRVTMFSFPLWTAAIIMGAIWADEAWGRAWGWDPKEIWSFITWIIYAAYLHARATAGWRGNRAAVLQLVGFAALMFNFFGVNYLFEGLHSYA